MKKRVRQFNGERKRNARSPATRNKRSGRQFAELDAIYHTAPLGLCALDRELRFRRINQRLADMNGVPVNKHIGKRVREVVPSIGEQAEEALREVLKTGKPGHFEFRGETKA